MKHEDKYKIEKDDRGLVLTPEGTVDDYILQRGFHRCGVAHYGISIQYGENSGGSVLTLDDIVRLRNFLNLHLQEVYKIFPN